MDAVRLGRPRGCGLIQKCCCHRQTLENYGKEETQMIDAYASRDRNLPCEYITCCAVSRPSLEP